MFPVGTLTLAQLSAKLPAYPKATTAFSGTDLRGAVLWGCTRWKGNFNTPDECYGNWTVEVLWQDMKGYSSSLHGERMTSRCRKGKQSQGSLCRSQPMGRAQTWGESCATFTRWKQFCDSGVKREKRNALWPWRKDVTNLYFLIEFLCHWADGVLSLHVVPLKAIRRRLLRSVNFLVKDTRETCDYSSHAQ